MMRASVRCFPEESGVRVDERGLGSVERAFAQAIGQPMEDAGAVLVD